MCRLTTETATTTIRGVKFTVKEARRELLQLSEYDPVLFRKAPLQQVVGQVRFPVLPRFADGSFIAPFQEGLQEDYPTRVREESVGLSVSSGDTAQTRVESRWRFSTRDHKWSVVLGDNAVTLEATGYTSVDEFLERFAKILKHAIVDLSVSDRTRLGLRYINQIRHPKGVTLGDWAQLLRPELVGFAGSDLIGGQVEDSRHELRVKRDDGMLRVRHGLASVQADLQEPGGEDRFYLLDLDYYDATERELAVSEVIEAMRGYNDFMYRLFRWSLSAELFNYLEPYDVTSE